LIGFLQWILAKVLGVTEAAKLVGTKVVEGTQSLITKTTDEAGNLFDQIIAKVIPQGLIDFIKSPIDYILENWLGIDVDKNISDIEAPNLGTISAADKQAKKAQREKMIAGILDHWPGYEWTRPDAIIKIAANQILDMLGMAKGGTFQKGQPMIVGELGPEMILPDQGGQVINAQRTQQMLQAGMQRGVGGAGGGGITSINTGGNVVSAPTTNYVNNGIAARRPIILAA